MSAYMHLTEFVFKHLNSPDPSNFNLMNFLQKQITDPKMVSICTFLANVSMMPTEITKLDEQFLSKFESMDFSDAIKHAEV